MSRVLVLDDSAIDALLLQRVFSRAGYTARSVTSAIAAFEMLEQHQPELLFTDVMMPEMTGYEVARRVRQKYDPVSLPIIVVTSECLDVVRKNFDASVQGFISKPFNINEIVGLCQNFLAKPPAEREVIFRDYNREPWSLASA